MKLKKKIQNLYNSLLAIVTFIQIRLNYIKINKKIKQGGQLAIQFSTITSNLNGLQLQLRICTLWEN